MIIAFDLDAGVAIRYDSDAVEGEIEEVDTDAASDEIEEADTDAVVDDEAYSEAADELTEEAASEPSSEDAAASEEIESSSFEDITEDATEELTEASSNEETTASVVIVPPASSVSNDNIDLLNSIDCAVWYLVGLLSFLVVYRLCSICYKFIRIFI